MPRNGKGGGPKQYPGGPAASGNGGGRPPGPATPQRVATGQPYGQAQRQTRSLRAMPIGQPGQPPPPPPPPPNQGQRFDQAMQTAMSQPGGEEARLNAPTKRPGEPLTAGLASGAGPGPESIPAITPNVGVDDLGLFLRELYRAQPSEDLRQLIQQHDMKRPSDLPVRPMAGQTAPPGMPPGTSLPNMGGPMTPIPGGPPGVPQGQPGQSVFGAPPAAPPPEAPPQPQPTPGPPPGSEQGG